MREKREIKGWAVINTELNEVCSFVDIKTFETQGSAFFTSDIVGLAKKEAQKYKAGLSRYKEVKIFPCKLIY